MYGNGGGGEWVEEEEVAEGGWVGEVKERKNHSLQPFNP